MLEKKHAKHWGGRFCYDLIQHLPFTEANILKYLYRFREKNGVEDLQKALDYTLLLQESFPMMIPDMPQLTMDNLKELQRLKKKEFIKAYNMMELKKFASLEKYLRELIDEHSQSV